MFPAQQAKSGPYVKPQPKLENVTIPAPSDTPESEQFDTTTPVDTTVVPFTMRDMAKWGPWLLYRLTEFWPHLHELNYAGRLSQLMGDNDVLFLRTRRAIILATVSRETLETRPNCQVSFIFKHHPASDEEDKDVRILLRQLDLWACSKGVRHIRIMNKVRCDLNWSRLKDALHGEDAKHLTKDLDA